MATPTKLLEDVTRGQHEGRADASNAPLAALAAELQTLTSELRARLSAGDIAAAAQAAQARHQLLQAAVEDSTGAKSGASLQALLKAALNDTLAVEAQAQACGADLQRRLQQLQRGTRAQKLYITNLAQR